MVCYGYGMDGIKKKRSIFFIYLIYLIYLIYVVYFIYLMLYIAVYNLSVCMYASVCLIVCMYVSFSCFSCFSFWNWLFFCGFVVLLWFCGFAVLWFCGFVVLWFCYYWPPAHGAWRFIGVLPFVFCFFFLD
ncbi:hypothetical protein BZA77DRAFT_130453 [Pyronema omphalodes]|nr:hypothetical protein BZA77DRAFT_130453 [Pyronema omphalodes]